MKCEECEYQNYRGNCSLIVHTDVKPCIKKDKESNMEYYNDDKVLSAVADKLIDKLIKRGVLK